jgi:hypothetical protein
MNMAWYKTGSVSVTTGQTSVTATGTKFATNARVGDGFRAPDGEWYEVTNIASETVLGIYPAYQGVTVSNSTDYMIAPLQGYNKDSADRLRAITDSIRDFSEDVAAAAASAAAALVSENAAEVSETNAKASELAAKASELSADVSADAADVSEANAAASATAADVSADAALVSENNAKTSETNSKTSETNSKASEDAAAASATAANASKVAAKASEDAAKVSETNALASQNSAAADATIATTKANIATSAATSADADADRAEVARDDAIAAAATVTGNLMDMGPVDFSSGVYPTKPAVSSFWKVTVGGSATDAGVTIEYGVGDTLVFSKPMENFYKIDNTESVSSVAGKTGVVTLVKADVGLDNVDNTSDASKPVSAATQTALNGKEPTITTLPISKGGTGGETQAAAQTALGLVPTGANTDVTAGRLLKVGDYGLGSVAISVTDANNAISVNGGIYKVLSPFTNCPTATAYIIHSFTYDAEVTQIAYLEGGTSSKCYMRQYRAGWQAWVKTSTAPMVGDNPTMFVGDIDDTASIPYGYVMAGASTTGTKPPSKTYGILQTVGNTPSSGSAIRQVWNDFDGAVGTKTTWIRDKYGTGVWGNWRLVFDQNTIVGTVINPATVGQSAIIERGTNGNGEYTKFVDGTQIAWRSITAGTGNSYSLAGGILYGGDAFGGSTPVTFTSEPVVTVSVLPGSGNPTLLFASCFSRPSSNSFGSWRAVTESGSGLNFGTVVVKLTAIGRWY